MDLKMKKACSLSRLFNMVEGDGFEPSKAEPADLQSAPFGHSGTPPRGFTDNVFVITSLN